MGLDLENEESVSLRQRKELGEIVLGFESRNKYEIDGSRGAIGFAAEQGKGLMATVGRQLMGHWRKFDIHIFDTSRELAYVAHHPFRWFFQRLEISDPSGGLLGVIQQRFGILYKKFDIIDSTGRVVMNMEAPMWKIWTFPLFKMGREAAVIKKKWSGLLKEAFTDADNFTVTFNDPRLSTSEKALAVVAALFVDLIYFEKKANS